MYKSKKRRCNTIISHVNSNKSNNLNISNSDNDVGTSNLHHINVQDYSPFNSCITSQKVIDIESSFSINYERTYQKNISEEISSHQNSKEIIEHACDNNGINLVNTQEEAGVTCIHAINETNDISVNDDDNYIQKYYAPFLSSNIHEDVSSGIEYNSAKRRVRRQKNVILDLLLTKSKIF